MAQNSGSPSNSDNSVPWGWLAVGCGGCLVLTTAAVVTLVVLIGRTMQFAIGPDGVKPDRAPFAYTIPGDSEGVLDMTMFGMQVVQITSTDTPPSVLLTMGRLPGYLESSLDQTFFIESFQESMIEDQNYQFADQRTEERPLCDQTVSVVVQSGRLQEDQTTHNVASLVATVDHNRRTQFVWILAHGDSAVANADQVFSSLECQ